MYGVVEIAGHQYKVQAGDLIDVEKLTKEEGKKEIERMIKNSKQKKMMPTQTEINKLNGARFEQESEGAQGNIHEVKCRQY